MNDQPNDPYATQQLWRPYAPSPFVTHQDLGPVHQRIGALEQAQIATAQAYNHLRGDILTRFDKIEKLIEAQKPADTGGITLTTREMVAVVVALILAGAILSRLPGVANLLGA